MALFRRMKSPRSEFRNTSSAGVSNCATGIPDKQNQQSDHQQDHKRPAKSRGKSYSAHRRHKSDELKSIVETSIEFEEDIHTREPVTFLSQTEVVDQQIFDYQLSDPGPFPPLPPHLPPRHRGGSGSSFNLSRENPRSTTPGWRRTQSSGTMSSSRQQHLPPHNHHHPPHPPTQEYFVPADTLVRNVQRDSILGHMVHNGTVVGGGPPSSHSSKSDRRNKEMHNKIVSQNDPSSILNRRRSRSLEKLVDIGDYSLPCDVVPDRNDKSRSPDGHPSSFLSQPQTVGQKTHSDSNLSAHSTTPPTKPFTTRRREHNPSPPAFAPPPPPSEEEQRVNPPHSPTVIRRMDDYEEPWNSSKFLPRHHHSNSRKQRAETSIRHSESSHKSSKPRSNTVHHEPSPEPELPPRPPRIPPDGSSGVNSSPQLDRLARTGERQSDDYCIPPDAMLHESNGIVNMNGHGTGIRDGTDPQMGAGQHAYVNQPPIPPHNKSKVKQHRYPPLLPSDHYITDIQNLPPPAFPIDTTLPLEEQPWFHGKISRDQAEDILYNQPDFSFLLRKSESSRMDYSLSIRDRTSPAAQGFIHLKITHERGGYVLGQFSSPFHSVPMCIAYYTQKELTIKHINHRRLGFPVGRFKTIPVK